MATDSAALATDLADDANVDDTSLLRILGHTHAKARDAARRYLHMSAADVTSAFNKTAHAQTQPLKPRAGLGLQAASSGLESGLGPSLSLAQKPTVAHALAKRVGKMNKRMNGQEEAGGAPRLAAVPPASKPRKRFVRDHDESEDDDDDDENDGGRGGGGRRDAFGASKLSRQPLWSQLVPKKKNKKSKKKKTAL